MRNLPETETNELTTRMFRRTMGMFATGVSILATSDGEGEIVGMTANAISSVSLEPMLVLVCVGKQAKIAPYILNSDGFSLSFLDEDQETLSSYFAGIWDNQSPAPDYEFEAWQPDAPHLLDSIGAIACKQYEILEGGDHWIVIGEVTALKRPVDPGEPLIFYNGLYRTLEELDETFGE